MMADISKIDMERINGLIDKFNEITLNFTNLLNNIDSFHIYFTNISHLYILCKIFNKYLTK